MYAVYGLDQREVLTLLCFGLLGFALLWFLKRLFLLCFGLPAPDFALNFALVFWAIWAKLCFALKFQSPTGRALPREFNTHIPVLWPAVGYVSVALVRASSAQHDDAVGALQYMRPYIPSATPKRGALLFACYRQSWACLKSTHFSAWIFWCVGFN